MNAPTLLTRWANFEADSLTAAGFDAAEHLRTCGHPMNREPGWSRMPWAVVASMWRAAEKRTGDPNLGLHAAGRVSFEQPGFVAYAMLSGAHLRESFQFLVDFQRLCVDARILSFEERGRRDAVVLHWTLDPKPSKFHPEFLFLVFVRGCRHVLGADFAPAAIHLSRTVSPQAGEYAEIFGCPVYWDQGRDEMLVDIDWSTRPSPYAHPETMRSLRERATQFTQQYAGPNWISKVKALVERFLPDGDATMHLVAQDLGISPRTLQRRLAEEGGNFDDIREAVRRARALELVGKDRVSVAAIAEQLGFSDARAFRRAFRRWTGTTPSEMGSKTDSAPSRSRFRR